jgi:tight adherence protein B
VALTAAVLAGFALTMGMPFALVAAGLGVAWEPMVLLLLVPAWVIGGRHRRRVGFPDPDDEAAFLQGLAAELAAGAPPRAALVAASSRAPQLDLHAAVRLAAAGLGSERVAAALESGLPTHGRLTAAAWNLTATAGGPAAAVFELLAVRTAEEGALVRERRALTAQARASAWVVAGLPVLLLAGMLVTGRLRPGSDPALGLVIGVGVVLQALGVIAVWSMLRRAT